MNRTRFRKYVSLFFWATIFALGVRLFVIEDYRVFSDSMAPELLAGDLIFVNKASFNVRLPFSSYEILRLRRPQRGEIVAFALPDRGGETYIKRVVANEGDEVSIRGGVLHVNGKSVLIKQGAGSGLHLAWESLDSAKPYPVAWDKSSIPDYGPVHVPQGHFFALGDNRVKSVDSRIWGPVPYSCLKGRVSLIWLSVGSEGMRSERIARWVRS